MGAMAKFPIETLREMKVSDLEGAQTELLYSVLENLEMDVQLHEDRNLSFLAELYLAEKMKGNNANKDTMKQIEAIAISAQVIDQTGGKERKAGKQVVDRGSQIHAPKRLKDGAHDVFGKNEIMKEAARGIQHAKTLKEVEQRLIEKYGEGISDKYLQRSISDAFVQLRTILTVFGISENDLSGLVGNKILDIGCGSKDKERADRYARYIKDKKWNKKASIKEYSGNRTPWLCRALHEAGADITGVDRGDNKGESFRSRKIAFDYETRNFLPKSKYGTFDCIVCINVIDFFDDVDLSVHTTPELREPYTYYSDAYRHKHFFHGNVSDLRDNLHDEITRLLKNGGFFITCCANANTSFIKKDELLVKYPEQLKVDVSVLNNVFKTDADEISKFHVLSESSLSPERNKAIDEMFLNLVGAHLTLNPYTLSSEAVSDILSMSKLVNDYISNHCKLSESGHAYVNLENLRQYVNANFKLEDVKDVYEVLVNKRVMKAAVLS